MWCHAAAFLFLKFTRVVCWDSGWVAHTQTHARTLQPPTQLHHARTCTAAPHAACHAEAVCRSTQKMRLSQARFECLPIFPPCLSQTGRKSSKHCSRVPPHMKTQCVALMGSVDRFSHVDRDRKRFSTRGLRGPWMNGWMDGRACGRIEFVCPARLAIRMAIRQFGWQFVGNSRQFGTNSGNSQVI